MWRGVVFCLVTVFVACGLGAPPECRPIERSYVLCDQNAIYECPVETVEQGEKRRAAIARCNRMDLRGQISCLGNLRTPKVQTVLVEECEDKTCVETTTTSPSQARCR